MTLTGKLLIGQQRVNGRQGEVQAINPATNELLAPVYHGASLSEVQQACDLAEAAFDTYRATSPETRAGFLETIAEEIEALGAALVERAIQESGLPQARLEGERGRTCGQLRLFADVLRRGEWQDVRLDPALPERSPMPRPELRQRRIAVGPVAVFGASNFPLAFSVAGGDTASALAAGCPVVVKAHPAHPGTSDLVGQAIQKAVVRCELPEGVFSLLYGVGNEVGQALVSDPRIQAVGFTGSRAGGLALIATVQQRAQPIPVYAEMSSINPVLLLSGALQTRASELAAGFVSSLTLGAGQFCTNPGLLLAVKGNALEGFVEQAKQHVEESIAQTMLTPGIHSAYQQGVDTISSHAERVAQGRASEGPNQCRTALFRTTAETFWESKELHQEVFGAAALIVECHDQEEMLEILNRLEGQLTITLQMADEDLDSARHCLPLLERKAGRLLVNGWPTGVEVCDAMVHGGPFPATSDTRTTSVGSTAIERFLRPVCYQNFPAGLLPEACA
ncbi:aldehyde dehydrogenase (NADP(+)) [Vreelandella olivaria]|uniref:aldehyde dehydrogenase (NADP(+)) n=1 Tax=Vreelandella olivaria TaxID=390919 RepID=UPI00201ED325|nr:aldehyde dehydrogenase (NADP(+)) [Halomonas olivaria]